MRKKLIKLIRRKKRRKLSKIQQKQNYHNIPLTTQEPFAVYALILLMIINLSISAGRNTTLHARHANLTIVHGFLMIHSLVSRQTVNLSLLFLIGCFLKNPYLRILAPFIHWCPIVLNFQILVTVL